MALRNALSVRLRLLVPLLLLFPRTRVVGLVVGLLFHTMLTFDVEKHFFDFSSTMFALLSVFLSDHAVRSFSRVPLASRYPALRLGFLIWYLLAMLALFLSLDTRYGYSAFFIGRQVLWWTLNSWLILAFAALFRNGWRDGELSGTRRLCGLTACLPILLFLNGITPYLGLKTRSSLDMYSNLRAEAGRENHFIIRKSADLLGNMADLAVVISTSDAELEKEIIQPALLITFFELRRRVLKNPGMQLRFHRDGKEYILSEAGKDPIFAEAPSQMLLKLLWYRPVDPRTPARCLW